MVAIPRDLLPKLSPDEAYLFLWLRSAHAGLRETFAIAVNSMCVSLGWARSRLMRARDALETSGLIRCVHRGGHHKGDASQYRFGS
jgi:hypothetical protein